MSQVPELEGIYQLLDKQENIIYIKGAMNLHRDLEEQLKLYEKARYFTIMQVAGIGKLLTNKLQCIIG